MKNISSIQPLPHTVKRAVLYARVSSDDRRYATSSIEGQLAECREYAAKCGYTVIAEFSEDPTRNTSGADMLPELSRILALAPSSAFDVLICRELDRLARNRFKQMVTELELESHGVKMEYVKQQFEDSHEGKLLKGLMSEFAEYERSKIRERTRNGKIRAVEAGSVAIGGSVAPYGYDLVTVTDPITHKGRRTLAVNPLEADVVRTIFDLYVNKGMSLYGIRQYLYERAIPKPGKGAAHKASTRFPESWSIATLSGILHSEVYCGRWHFNKSITTRDAATGKRRRKLRPRIEWLEVPCPAIIEESVFATVEPRTERNKAQMGHQHRYFYVLGGMIRCGQCGSGVTGKTRPHANGKDYTYYHCAARHRSVNLDVVCRAPLYRTQDVEAVVWEWVKGLLLEPNALRLALEEQQATQAERVRPKIAMLENVQDRVREREGQKARLIDAYSKGILSLDELADQKSLLDKEISELHEAATVLREEAVVRLFSAEHVESIEAIASEVREGMKEADNDMQAQRAIYQLLDVHVTLCFDDNKRRWADVTCSLGETQLTTLYNASDCTKHRCVIVTRLWL